MNKKVSIFPLSNAQERLWILDQMNHGGIAYNVPIAIEITGNLDVHFLLKSLQDMINRHEMLRTSFKFVGNVPGQLIHSEVELTIQDLNFQIIENEVDIKSVINHVSQKQNRLLDAPLFKIQLFKLREGHHVLFINFHHIIIDEWSIVIFFRELKELYESKVDDRKPELEELPIQYKDFAVWQREWVQGEVFAKLVKYWERKLDAVHGVELPTDRTRPSVQTFKGLTQTFHLDDILTKKIKEFARAEKVTLNMLLLTVFKVLLNRYTQQEDIAVGMPIANRNREELEGLIGFFLNTLVVRTDLSGEPTFRELLQRVKGTLLEGYEHQEMPFEKLVELLNPERDLSRTPLFQVMFVMAESGVGIKQIGEMVIAPLHLETGTSKFDLTMFVRDIEGHLEISFEYSTDLFNADRIERMGGHYQSLLEDILENPEKKIWELELLTKVEKNKILIDWNSTDVDYPKDKCLHQLFEEQVERSPDEVALKFGKEHLTYKELNERANQVGHYLRKLGVGPDVLVGICVERSLEMVVGLLGILKAGGAYVPLDPSYPVERLQFMLEDTNATILLTQSSLEINWGNPKLKIINLDRNWEEIERERTNNIENGVRSNNLIYVIYTSGSTGKPKGAQVLQRGFVNLLNWFFQQFDLTSSDRTLLISPYSFDLTQKNIFTPLIIGGQLCLPDTTYYEPEKILTLIYEYKITWVNCAPSAFYPLINYGKKSRRIKKHLRYVILGGEPIVFSKLANWATKTSVRIVNTYGPTECSDVSSFYIIPSLKNFDEHRSIPIGKAIYNVKQYILDKKLMLCPIGVPGELFIGGVGVGKGYLNNADLNRLKFQNLSNLKDNELVYKTGDIACYLPDGNIDFIGRDDGQVKIRGFRVEIGEIENIIRQYNNVQDVAVLVNKDQEEHDHVLWAYIVASDLITHADIYSYMVNKLPAYMIPSTYIFVNELPKTPSGKVDRKALLKIKKVDANLPRAIIAPMSSWEEKLVMIWSDVLGAHDIGIRDNFFELGGNSLMVIQVISRAAYAGINISVQQFYKTPTIQKLIALSSVTYKPVIEEAIFSKIAPLTPQQAYFFSSNTYSDTNKFVISMMVEVEKEVDINLFSQAVNFLIANHESLRVRFIIKEDQVKQLIVDQSAFEFIPVKNLTSYHAIEKETAIDEFFLELRKDLNIYSGPLFNLGYISMGKGLKDRIIIVLHHLIADAYSGNLFLEDLDHVYSQLNEKKSMSLPSKRTSIMGWLWELDKFSHSEAYKKDLQYWMEATNFKIGRFSSNHSGNERDEGGIVKKEINLSNFKTNIVNKINSQEFSDGLLASLFMTLGDILLGDYVGVRVTLHGRESINNDVDLSRTIGWFAGNVPFFLPISSLKSFGSTILALRHEYENAPRRRMTQSIERWFVGDVELQKRLSDLVNSVDLQYNYIGKIGNGNNNSKFTKIQYRFPDSINRIEKGTRIYLSASVDEAKGCLNLNWSFNKRYYLSSSIEKLANTYITNLKNLNEHLSHS